MLIVQFKNGNKIEEECSLEDWERDGNMVLWSIWGSQSPLLDEFARAVYIVK